MTRIITALFDTRADADAGAARLREAGVDASDINVHDKSSHDVKGEHSTREDKGLWASIKGAFVPDRDRHAYEEGIRRGGFLLTAEVDDGETGAAVDALEDAASIDLDERSAQWRNDGWVERDEVLVEDGDAEYYGVRDVDGTSPRYRSYSSRGVAGDI
ncbi:hypothetical protein [Sphingomonas corticis]|uniref:General stress protein 17M-like domain-containing protein n=1 Tax=Sphingomonas corticis TaxID=2722791 RepID=A0ABX1CRZ6_9SPHN|nr:hypothetical protein [Sphingomonas corticis]NJR80714.1 hypothetical protein [Sphingomonas corticis]